MPACQTTIANLNDQCRQSIPHARCYLTRGALAHVGDNLNALNQVVQTFDAFTPDNDPYGEHDFGAFDFERQRLFWKIDTYAGASLKLEAEDPLDPQAVRVITILLAEEY